MFKGSKKHHFTFVYICIYLPFAVACEQTELSPRLSLGRFGIIIKKTFCQRSGSWNVANVSGECSNYSKILEFIIFSSKILEIFENSFWCLKFPPKFRNYVASNFFIGLATPRTKKFEAYILSSLIFFFVERPARVLLGVLIYLFTCWSIFLTQTPYLH